MRLLLFYLMLILCHKLESADVKSMKAETSKVESLDDKNVQLNLVVDNAKSAQKLAIDLGTVREIAQRQSDSFIAIKKGKDGVWKVTVEPKSKNNKQSISSSSTKSGFQGQSQKQNDRSHYEQSQNESQNQQSRGQTPGSKENEDQSQSKMSNSNYTSSQRQRSKPFQGPWSQLYSAPSNNLYIGTWNSTTEQCTCLTPIPNE